MRRTAHGISAVDDAILADTTEEGPSRAFFNGYVLPYVPLNSYAIMILMKDLLRLSNMTDDKRLVADPFDLDILTEKQRILVETYLETGGNRTLALKKAGLTTSGKNPFRSPAVRRAINHAMRPSLDKAGLTFDKHLQFVAAIAYGDPAEICEMVDVNCRHCWGLNHEYQFTQFEFREQLDKEIRDFKKDNGITNSRITQEELEDMGFCPVSSAGGFGWDQWREPNPQCPECNGDGFQKMRLYPWATHHPLFAGVSYDKNGNMVVKLRNQDNALEHVSKLLGFLVDKTEVTVVSHVEKLMAAQRRANEEAKKRAVDNTEDDD